MIYPSVVEYGVQSYPHPDMEHDPETYMGGWRFMRIEYRDPEQPYSFLEHHVWMPPTIGSYELEQFMQEAIDNEERRRLSNKAGWLISLLHRFNPNNRT